MEKPREEARQLFELSYAQDELSDLKRFLDEAGKTPLLSAAEEVALAKRIQQGDEAAKEHMLRANILLVADIARSYSRRMDIMDCIQEGYFGLHKAVERFDPERGFRFSTFATKHINSSISKAAARHKSAAYRPPNIHFKYRKIMRVANEIAVDTGTKATPDLISEKTGIPVEEVSKLYNNPALEDHLYLDEPVTTDDGDRYASLAGSLVEGSAEPVEETAHRSHAQDRIRRLASRVLNSMDMAVVNKLYGLDGGGGQNHTEIGRAFGFSPQRSRYVERRALRKLAIHAAEHGIYPDAG